MILIHIHSSEFETLLMIPRAPEFAIDLSNHLQEILTGNRSSSKMKRRNSKERKRKPISELTTQEIEHEGYTLHRSL